MHFFRPAESVREEEETLLVEAGRVSCPREGDADIEQCYICGWMAESDLGASQPSLRCLAHRRDPGVAARIAHIL